MLNGRWYAIKVLPQLHLLCFILEMQIMDSSADTCSVQVIVSATIYHTQATTLSQALKKTMIYEFSDVTPHHATHTSRLPRTATNAVSNNGQLKKYRNHGFLRCRSVTPWVRHAWLFPVTTLKLGADSRPWGTRVGDKCKQLLPGGCSFEHAPGS